MVSDHSSHNNYESTTDSMPQWLIHDENYHPSSVKSSGLLKSEGIIVKLLDRLQAESSVSKNHRLHPVTYLVNLIVALFILSYTSLVYVVWGVGIIEAAMLITLPGGELLIKILKRSFWLLLLDALVYIPSFFLGTFNWLFLIKMFLILIASITYASSTSVFDFIIALKQLHVPNFMIFQFDIFVKHLHVLGMQLLQMLHAVECRTVGDSRSHRKLWSLIVGNLYLQMVELGKELFDALEARAFTGKYAYMVHKIKSTDILVLCADVLAIIAVIIIQIH